MANSSLLKEAEWSISETQAGGDRAVREARYFSALVSLLRSTTDSEIKKVADIPCGWGRHDGTFREGGLDVYGVDIESDFIAKAQRRYPEFQDRYVVADMRRTGLEPGSFDAVLNLFTSFGYFDYNGNMQTLHEFNRLLRRGGFLIMDLPNREAAVKYMRPIFANFASDSLVRLARNRIEGEYWVVDEEFLEKKYSTYQIVWHATKQMMFFSIEKLDEMLRQAGFAIAQIFKSLTFEFPDDDTQQITVAARKL